MPKKPKIDWGKSDKKVPELTARSAFSSGCVNSGIKITCDGRCPDVKDVKVGVTMQVASVVAGLLSEIDTEFICAMYGEDTGDEITICHVTCPKQVVSAALTEVDDDAKIPAEIDGMVFLGLMHSHVNMGAFWSAQDKESIVNYRLSVVVNKKWEYKAAIRTETACGKLIMEDVRIGMKIEYDEKVIAELKTNITKPVYKWSSTYRGANVAYGGYKPAGNRYNYNKSKDEKAGKPYAPPVNNKKGGGVDDPFYPQYSNAYLGGFGTCQADLIEWEEALEDKAEGDICEYIDHFGVDSPPPGSIIPSSDTVVKPPKSRFARREEALHRIGGEKPRRKKRGRGRPKGSKNKK